METQLERISAVECRVRVAIPWATVSPRWEQRLKDLGRRAQVPGFRRGKVPVRVIERMFGPSVRDELARDLVTETFPDAVAEHEQTPLTEPVRESFSLKRGEPFTYVVRFEVPPMIEPKDYEGVPVRRRPAALDEARVDREIAALRDQHTEIRPIPEDSDRIETRAGDLWTLDLEGKVGDAPVSLKDVKVEIGATVKEAIPGLAKALEGTPLAAVGATRELSFTTDEANGGRPAQLKVGLRDVREKIQPALDDEFAADTGLAETFAELRAQIEGRVRDEDQQQAEREARTRLVNELLERNDFEVAPSMIAREAAAQVNLYKQQVAQQGLTLAQIGQTEAQLYNQIRPRAAVNVRAYLLLDAIGKKHEIDVSDEELSEEIQQMADERNQNVDRLRASLERDNQLLLLRARLRETKILDFLMEKAEITEAPDPEHDHDHDHDHDHHDHDHDHDHHHHHHDHDHDHDHDHAAD